MSSTPTLEPTTGAPRRGLFRRIAIVTGAAAAALVIGAGTAMAHVSVTPGEVAPGSYSKLTFRVPNESDTDATTDKVVINIPAETAFASVRTKQLPGWKAELVKTTLPTPIKSGNTNLSEAVTQIILTAEQGNGIAVGQFGEFDLSVGPVPAVDQIVFTVEQTYSDGTVSNWNELQAEGAEEPKHPAPVLKIVGAATDGHGDAHGGASVEASAEDHDNSSSTTALIFGIVGTVLGLAGVGIALVAVRGRQKAA